MPGTPRTLFAARMFLASGVVAAGVSVVAMFDETPTPAVADATQTVALYEMNEPAGATVLVDSSGNGLNGAIGPNIVKPVVFDGATGHQFLDRSPTMLPVEPERLDTVPHNTQLNPDALDFAITVRYRTDKSFGNLIQKGQNQTAGGYFKIELPRGRPTCLFKGVGTQGAVKPPAATPGLPDPYDLSDNTWHTIRCERLQNRVALWIDGVEVNRKVGPTGNIANTKNLSIAGKSTCDQVLTTCDYFVGDIDWVRLEKGDGTAVNRPPVARFSSTCPTPTPRTGVCNFNGNTSSDPDNDVLSFSWNFDDGTTGTGATTSHAYVTAGPFTVSLTVTDDNGASSTVTHTVRPTPPPTTTTAPTTTTTTIVAQEPPPPGRVTEVKGAATGLQIAQRLPVVTGE